MSEALPDEVWLAVFAKCPLASVKPLATTCKKFDQLLQDNDFWKFVLIKNGISPESSSRQSDYRSFMKNYVLARFDPRTCTYGMAVDIDFRTVYVRETVHPVSFARCRTPIYSGVRSWEFISVQSSFIRPNFYVGLLPPLSPLPTSLKTPGLYYYQTLTGSSGMGLSKGADFSGCLPSCCVPSSGVTPRITLTLSQQSYLVGTQEDWYGLIYDANAGEMWGYVSDGPPVKIMEGLPVGLSACVGLVMLDEGVEMRTGRRCSVCKLPKCACKGLRG